MKNTRHTAQSLLFAALVCLLPAAISCEKHGDTPKEPDTLAPIPIRFGANPVSRALLESNNFRTDGNRLKIYDFLTGFEGKVDGVSWPAEGAFYIDDILYYDSNADAAIWQYQSEDSYVWTNSGTHRFFGYLTEDAVEDSDNHLMTTDLFGTLPNIDLSFGDPRQVIPVTTMTSETPQLDFVFSEVYNRTQSGSSHDYSSIPLRFQHLFSAISITVENTMDEDDVVLESLSFGGIHNRQGASIAFGPTTQLAYNDPTSVGDFLQGKTYGTLAHKTIVNDEAVTEKYDAFTGIKVDASHPAEYRLVWPQSADVVSPQSEPDALGRYPVTDSLISIGYTLKGIHYDKHVKFPYTAWERGRKHQFNLMFSDRIIELTVRTDDWDYHEFSQSFIDKSIEGGRLEVDGPAIIEGKTATVDAGKTIKCHFHLRTPQGGTWVIGKVGDVEYFTISPNTGTIDASQNGGRIDFDIIPNLSLPRDSDKVITLSCAVRMGDRESDANTELNRDKIKFILLK